MESIGEFNNKSKTSEILDKNFEKLPEIIDKKGTLFVYGFLLDHKNLQRLFEKSRGKEGVPKIEETRTLEDATSILNKNSDSVVILRNVRLDGIRAQIITADQLDRAYEKKFGEKNVSSELSNKEQYLYVRPAEDEERGKSVNGGLIIGLTAEDLRVIDVDEAVNPEKEDGVYFRKRVKELKVEEKKFKPKYIEFYAGNVGDIHKYLDPENKGKESFMETCGALNKGKKTRGQLPESAKWPHSKEHSVRSKSE